MTILTVVGARPQFIKAAAVSRIMRKEHTEILVHTGQHYDANMSEVFFNELEIPLPDYNLGIGSGSHAKQTAEMLVQIEKILLDKKPDYLMVYGDTNSTLAGALAASKIHIPVIHVEAGLRSFNMRMPEEQNRVLTDHISTLLFCPTSTAVENLHAEGLHKGVHLVGDVMCDAVKFFREKLDFNKPEQYTQKLRGLFSQVPYFDSWYLGTIHRAENTEDAETLRNILEVFEKLDLPVLFPLHPRTKPLVRQLVETHHYKNTLFVEPIGYLDMLYFTQGAKKVITDSGGLQKEAYILKTPCITIRPQTEWVETLTGNWNVLSSSQMDEMLPKILETEVDESIYRDYYGAGDAALQIMKVLREG